MMYLSGAIFLGSIPSLISAQSASTVKSCGDCSNVLEISQIVVLAITPNGQKAITDTYTIPYMTVTRSPNGSIEGQPRAWKDGDYLSYGVASSNEHVTVVSTISGLISSYTSIQEVSTRGACVEQGRLYNISEAGFKDIPTVKASSLSPVLQSTLALYIPNPTCTTTTFNNFLNVSRPIVQSAQAKETATVISDAPEVVSPSLSRSARLGLIAMLSIGLALILITAGFLIVSVRKTKGSLSARSRSGGNYSKLNEHIQSTNVRKESWKAPLSMSASLFTGLVFALGHHFLCQNISGQPVDAVRVSQSWIFRISNLLAFLAKLCFSITVGTTFVQLQWLKLRQRPLSVKNLDALSTIFGDFLAFFEKVWFQFPSLTILAILYWLLPLVPIITPRTLNIVAAPYTKVISTQVPSLDFDGGGYADSGALYAVHGSPSAKRATFPSAISGKITPMIPSYPNSTYTIDFFGPGIRCQSANNSYIIDMTKKQGFVINGEQANHTYFEAYIPTIPGLNDDAFADEISTDAARFFIVSYQFPGPGSGLVLTADGSTKSVLDVTECTLHNTSYNVKFEFKNGEQTTTVDSTLLDGVSYAPNTDSTKSDGPTGYISLMATLGAILLGKIGDYLPDRGTDTPVDTTMIELLPFSWYYADELRTTIPEMFQNMTLSIMAADQDLGLTLTQTVDAMITTYSSTYSYDPTDLLLVYGLAFLGALLCLVIGIYAFIANNDSYQNRFSTFIRGTEVAAISGANEDSGADPRPKAIGDALVFVPHTRDARNRSSYGVQNGDITARPTSISLSPLPRSTAQYQHDEL